MITFNMSSPQLVEAKELQYISLYKEKERYELSDDMFACRFGGPADKFPPPALCSIQRLDVLPFIFLYGAWFYSAAASALNSGKDGAGSILGNLVGAALVISHVSRAAGRASRRRQTHASLQRRKALTFPPWCADFTVLIYHLERGCSVRGALPQSS